MTSLNLNPSSLPQSRDTILDLACESLSALILNISESIRFPDTGDKSLPFPDCLKPLPFPHEINNRILDDLVSFKSKDSICALIRCCKNYHDRFAKGLYETIELDKGNVDLIFAGLEMRLPLHNGEKGEPIEVKNLQVLSEDERSALIPHSPTAFNRKLALLKTTTHLVIRDGEACDRIGCLSFIPQRYFDKFTSLTHVSYSTDVINRACDFEIIYPSGQSPRSLFVHAQRLVIHAPYQCFQAFDWTLYSANEVFDALTTESTTTPFDDLLNEILVSHDNKTQDDLFNSVYLHRAMLPSKILEHTRNLHFLPANQRDLGHLFLTMAKVGVQLASFEEIPVKPDYVGETVYIYSVGVEPNHFPQETISVEPDWFVDGMVGVVVAESSVGKRGVKLVYVEHVKCPCCGSP